MIPENNDGLWSRQLSSRQVPPSSWQAASYLDIDLPGYVPTHTYAAGIVGAGPAGLALAWQMAKEGISVVVVDNQLDGYWPNNYGVWSQEWEACGLPADTIGMIWPKTRIQYTEDEGVVLERPYGRIDREVCFGANAKCQFTHACVYVRLLFPCQDHVTSKQFCLQCASFTKSSSYDRLNTNTGLLIFILPFHHHFYAPTASVIWVPLAFMPSV